MCLHITVSDALALFAPLSTGAIVSQRAFVRPQYKIKITIYKRAREGEREREREREREEELCSRHLLLTKTSKVHALTINCCS